MCEKMNAYCLTWSASECLRFRPADRLLAALERASPSSANAVTNMQKTTRTWRFVNVVARFLCCDVNDKTIDSRTTRLLASVGLPGCTCDRGLNVTSAKAARRTPHTAPCRDSDGTSRGLSCGSSFSAATRWSPCEPASCVRVDLDSSIFSVPEHKINDGKAQPCKQQCASDGQNKQQRQTVVWRQKPTTMTMDSGDTATASERTRSYSIQQKQTMHPCIFKKPHENASPLQQTSTKRHQTANLKGWL